MGVSRGTKPALAGRASRRPDARRGARIPERRSVRIEPRASMAPCRTAPTPTSRRASSWSGRTRIRCGMSTTSTTVSRSSSRSAPTVETATGPAWPFRSKTRRSYHGELRRALPGGLGRPGLLPVRVAAIDRGRERPLRVLPRRRLARVHRWRDRRDRGQLQADRPGRAQLLPLPAGRRRVDPDLDWPGGRRRWVPEQRGLPLRQPDRRRRLGVLLFQATTRGRRHRRGSGICT